MKLRGRGPYGDVAILDKMAQAANWIDQCGATVFMSPLPKQEEIAVHGWQRLFLSRAIESLTKEELDMLYSELMRSHRDCLEDGGDFTPQIIRKEFPHLYPTGVA